MPHLCTHEQGGTTAAGEVSRSFSDQGRRLGVLGEQPPLFQGPSAPPRKDAATPNLDFSKFTCVYIIILKKLTWPKKMKTYEFREIFIE